jgi:hypothetical protein
LSGPEENTQLKKKKIKKRINYEYLIKREGGMVSIEFSYQEDKREKREKNQIEKINVFSGHKNL